MKNKYIEEEPVKEIEDDNITAVFREKIPVVTYSLIAINAAVWLIMQIYALLNSVNYEQLFILFGAKENFRIMSGEYWRFLTPIFIHVDWKHLMVNSLSLFVFGNLVEKLYGHKKFAVIYFVAGIIGNIASFMFSINPAVGASGAIYGLFGALLYFGVEKPALFRRYFGNNILIVIVINIVYGFVSPGIDNFAHLGGVIGGFLSSGIVKTKNMPNKLLGRPVFAGVTILVVTIGLYFGFNNSNNRNLFIQYKLVELDQLNETGNWKKAEQTAEEIIGIGPEDNKIRLGTLYVLALSEAYQGKYDEAIENAKRVKEIDLSAGCYLLGNFYFDDKQYELARQELNELVKLNPAYKEEVDRMIERIEELQ